MFLRTKDLLLQEKVELYNNIAKSGDCTGRLRAELQVSPSPRIAWEFESLGDMACWPDESDEGRLKNPFVGSGFSIDKPIASLHRSESRFEPGRILLAGSAAQARFGDPHRQVHSLRFLLPNARFQETNVVGQEHLQTQIKAVSENSQAERVSSAGRRIEAALDDTWSIRLETTQEALNWLARRNRNVGTLITTAGWLYHRKYDQDQPTGRTALPTLTLAEALDRLETLCLLLSYANGGYFGPPYVEGMQKEGKKRNFSATVLAYATTPLERLGTPWLAIDSDLAAYLRCFPTFSRMIAAPPWQEAFHLILMWYLQAIDPRNLWPIAAVAAGAALERLSVTILVREFSIRGLSNLEERIKRLLQQIGINTNPDTYDIETFVAIRNDATHPTPGTTIPDSERNRIILRAFQWIEEVLLWRLGYGGKYLDRSKKWRTSTEPRYDLSARDPSW
jgi:hypothetical protein